MTKKEVRRIVGSRGFFWKEIHCLKCHGGVKELDIILKNGLRVPPPTIMFACKNGLELSTYAESLKSVYAGAEKESIKSIRYTHVVKGSGDNSSIIAGTVAGAAVGGSLGAFIGAGAGMEAALARIVCTIIYADQDSKDSAFYVSFTLGDKKKVDRFFSKNYGSMFSPDLPNA